MCPDIRTRTIQEEEEIRYVKELLKIRAQEDEELVRAVEKESAKIRSESKTLVYWNIQIMPPLPEGYDLKSFSLNIRTALDRVNYRGPISIVAYRDVSKIRSNIQQQLLQAEIEMKHMPGDPWWHSYELMSEIIKNRPVCVAEHVWLWTELIVGGSPLSSDSVSDGLQLSSCRM